MSIEAHVERDFASRGHRVWLFDRVMGKTRVLRFIEPEDNRTLYKAPWEWAEAGDGIDVVPSLVLPDGALEVLLAEAGKITRASDATSDALADTRAVRDRLLTLVEKVTT